MLGIITALLSLAWRNLLASRTNMIIGALIFGGAFLLTLGSGMLSSIDTAMRRSISGSVAGDLQIYSADSLDTLELWAGPDSAPDLAPIPDFSRWRTLVEGVPNVKAVVPMGIATGVLGAGNSLDVALGDLRVAATERLQRPQDPAAQQAYEARKRVARQLISSLQEELPRAMAMAGDQIYEQHQLDALAQVEQPGYWDRFDADPLDALELLENRVAPLMADPPITFMRFLGTDLHAFRQAFDRMRIVDGVPVPEGRRGTLLSKMFFEESLKLKSARRLDLIREALARGDTIAGSEDLQRLVGYNKTGTRELVFQLHGPRADALAQRLRGELGLDGERMGELLTAFFDTNDANFGQRYDFFYQHIAPLVRLYRVQVGESFHVKALTRSGSIQAAPLKVYGTFEFEGLEKASLAGAINLMDMVSFRQLYGYQPPGDTAAQELPTRAEAEAALFGDPEAAVSVGASTEIPDPEIVRDGEDSEALLARRYSSEEMTSGLALHAAVLLKDPAHLEETAAEIRAAAGKAGLPMRVLSWREASGILGSFAGVVGGALFFAVFVIFLVALIIMNNAMVLGALRRTTELGTMRAMGAQRSLVLMMILFEMLLLGGVAGVGGALSAAGLITWLGQTGIPAPIPELSFFFAGPRLHPQIAVQQVLGALFAVVALSVVSTLYPAFLAARVPPRQAMQAEE